MSYGPYGQAVPPPQPPKQGMSTGAKIGLGCGGCLGVSLLLFLFVGCVAVIGSDTPEASSPPAATATTEEEVDEATSEETEEEVEEEPEEEPVEEDTSTIGDGIHQVGSGIAPGVYTTDGPNPDDLLPMCYYARLSGLSGEFDEIITNNNIEGPGTLEVAESDAALELSGGCEWTLQD
ncbi:hypothetical protein ACIRPH_27815 [Nocardiopsis sp. NPDC101807]|uniref:hypothetical protein n=1 Tax=Nocardiopsis sp. NPDC101807 TaxID=3364339 RepID=UPI003821C04B